MKISLTAVLRTAQQYWILIVAVLTIIGVSGYIQMAQPTGPAHEGGLVQVTQAVRPIAKLPDIADSVLASAQSVAVSNCSQNGGGKLLLISISQQHMWACDGAALARESAVTTGASALTNVDNATPTGTWHVYSKLTNQRLRGCDVNGCWNDPVAYWMPFDDQIGFHDSSWQTFAYGSSLYTTQGSHGCIHLPADVAAWVYGWAPVGTTVTIRA